MKLMIPKGFCTKFLLLALLTILSSRSQDLYGQTDTEFWFAGPEVSVNGGSHFDKPILLRITAPTAASTVTVTMPANASFPTQTVNVAAGSVSTLDLTPWINLIENITPDVVTNKGLYITATTPVSMYYEVQSATCKCNPEIFALKGTNALGVKFYMPFQNYLSNHPSYSPAPYSSLDIVASEDNTTVTITPTNAVVGHSAGTPYTINLNKGQTYSARATGQAASQHLTGTKVESNKPIAITMKDDLLSGAPYGGCADLAGDQVIPANKTGKEYILTRGYLNGGTEKAWAVATQNGTTVSVNGTAVATLNEGQHYVVTFSTPTAYVTADKDIYLMHMSGFGCEVGNAVLPPLTCSGSTLVGVARSTTESFYINLLVKTGAEGSFTFNGSSSVITAGAFSTVPNTGGQYKSASLSLSTGTLAPGAVAIVANTSDVFHMGVIHGGPGSGTRFGYFSSFASVNVVASSNTPVCPGQSINLSATPIVGATYSWSGPAGYSSTAQNPSVANANTGNVGTYTVVANDGACTGSSTVTVDLADPASITCPSDMTIPTLSSVSCGATATFMAAATGDPTPMITYSHQPGDTFPGGVTTVTAYATNKCGVDSCSFDIDVTGCCSLQVSVTPKCQGIVTGWEAPDSVTITASAYDGDSNYTYVWSPGGMTGPSITVLPDSTTFYTVTATDGKGCQATEIAAVTVTDAYASCHPNGKKVRVCHVPPGNPANEHDICIAEAAVKAHLAGGPGHGTCRVGPCDPCANVVWPMNGGNFIPPQPQPQAAPAPESPITVSAFPNPSTGLVTVELLTATDGPVMVSISNTSATSNSVLFNGNVQANEKVQLKFDGSKEGRGMYFLRVLSNQGQVMKKIIIAE